MVEQEFLASTGRIPAPSYIRLHHGPTCCDRVHGPVADIPSLACMAYFALVQAEGEPR